MFGERGHLVQVIMPPFMLMELVEADYLCIDVKHDVIVSQQYGKIHHFTVVRWSNVMMRSEVVGRVLINSMTRETIGEALISLFTMAECATGMDVDFFQVRNNIIFHFFIAYTYI